MEEEQGVEMVEMSTHVDEEDRPIQVLIILDLDLLAQLVFLREIMHLLHERE